MYRPLFDQTFRNDGSVRAESTERRIRGPAPGATFNDYGEGFAHPYAWQRVDRLTTSPLQHAKWDPAERELEEAIKADKYAPELLRGTKKIRAWAPEASSAIPVLPDGGLKSSRYNRYKEQGCAYVEDSGRVVTAGFDGFYTQTLTRDERLQPPRYLQSPNHLIQNQRQFALACGWYTPQLDKRYLVGRSYADTRDPSLNIPRVHIPLRKPICPEATRCRLQQWVDDGGQFSRVQTSEGPSIRNLFHSKSHKDSRTFNKAEVPLCRTI